MVSFFISAALVVAGSGAQATEIRSEGEQIVSDIERALASHQDGSVEDQPVDGVTTSNSDAHPLVASNSKVSVALPKDESTEVTRHSVGDLTVFENAGFDYNTAIQNQAGGAFRALVHIESAAAPTEYRFPISLSEGERLQSLEDGSVTVLDEKGLLVGTFAVPWAVDARGDAVLTEFAVEGLTLIQRVSLASVTSFPVVADPFWIPALMVMAQLGRHAATQAAARGISVGLMRQVVQNGVKSAGHRGTSIFTTGRGVSRVRVVVNNRTGKIITVTRG